jgi:hypothetical protein
MFCETNKYLYYYTKKSESKTIPAVHLWPSTSAPSPRASPSPCTLAIFFPRRDHPPTPPPFLSLQLRLLPYSFPHAAAPARSPPFLPHPASILARQSPPPALLPNPTAPHQSTERCHRPSSIPASPPSTQSTRVPPPSPLHRHL